MNLAGRRVELGCPRQVRRSCHSEGGTEKTVFKKLVILDRACKWSSHHSTHELSDRRVVNGTPEAHDHLGTGTVLIQR